MWKKLQICFILFLINSNIVNSNKFEYCQNPTESYDLQCQCVLKPTYINTVELHVNCSNLRLFSEKLPPVPRNAIELDFSWNHLNSIPRVDIDNRLQVLNLMYNNIISIVADDFKNYTSKMEKLYLNGNNIQHIFTNTFENLIYLRVLDLSHNNIQTLPSHVFAPLMILHTLDLSWNQELISNTQTYLYSDFFKSYGVNYELKNLSLKACGLDTLVLPKNISLEMLDLSENKFRFIPYLEADIKKLDLSGNLFFHISYNGLSKIVNLTELLFEDLPLLKSVEAYSLSNMRYIQKLSFQNCKRLTHFDSKAFGDYAPGAATLIDVNFRDTAINTLSDDDSLPEFFPNLQKLDIYGMPLLCDCHLSWLKELNDVEIEGVCMGPPSLRGRHIKNIAESEFHCRGCPNWVYALMIIVLIILITACIFMAIQLCRAKNGVTLHHKVGAGSPYAPLTIQSNNQEKSYY